MIDPFGRRLTYLRLSITDRCDLRCTYCMDESPEFLPRSEILSLEELDRLARVFVRKGVRKIRLTGGEPLTRRDVMVLVRSLGTLVRSGDLDEVTLTTNGTQLARYADGLAEAGIHRVNVSLDTLNPTLFSDITRLGSVEKVLEGIAAAKQAGLAVKVNMVVQEGVNDHELDTMIAWCGLHGFDLCLIEPMPMGAGGQAGLPVGELLSRLCRHWTLLPCEYATGGPARYVTVAQTGRRIGFISPLSHGFCDSCNRLRVTCSGQLYMCLGADRFIDLRPPLRTSEGDTLLELAIDHAVARRPQGHSFAVLAGRQEGSGRAMNLTGG